MEILKSSKMENRYLFKFLIFYLTPDRNLSQNKYTRYFWKKRI